MSDTHEKAAGEFLKEHYSDDDYFKFSRVDLKYAFLSGAHSRDTIIKELETALKRFERLSTAVFNDYPDNVIIKCEVTAGDIRAATKALNRGEK